MRPEEFPLFVEAVLADTYGRNIAAAFKYRNMPFGKVKENPCEKEFLTGYVAIGSYGSYPNEKLKWGLQWHIPLPKRGKDGNGAYADVPTLLEKADLLGFLLFNEFELGGKPISRGLGVFTSDFQTITRTNGRLMRHGDSLAEIDFPVTGEPLEAVVPRLVKLYASIHQ